MQLLSTNQSNTKIRKSAEGSPYRIASLSMKPDDIICPASKAADCRKDCLFHAGRGTMQSVINARSDKSRYWHNDRDGFLAQLCNELFRFIKSCKRSGDLPAARLNTISDINWEYYGIPSMFPELFMYDYTKRAARLGKTPDNYKLMFSYSSAPAYQGSVAKALRTSAPIAVVFRGGFPDYYLNRPVIDGDKSDLFNLKSENQIVALKLKGGKSIQQSRSAFIVDNPELLKVAA